MIKNLIGKIHNEDCLTFMSSLPDNCVDVIVTSPPYNKGFWSKNRNPNNGFKTKSRRIEYGAYNDNVPPEEYASNQREVISQMLRILKPTGSVFYNHTDILSEHQTKTPTWIFEFPLKQIIVWNRKNTPRLDKSYFFPITEWIFWIQKTSKARAFFDRSKAIFKTNVWGISPDVKNKFPAPFPIELPLNAILSCCPPGGVVFDPYMGSGTTAKAAVSLGVDWFGCELEPSRCCSVLEEQI
jgi:site-specific DNA-methyltransferase (adenine-specific)